MTAPTLLPENALRWVVKAHIDDNVCKPCKDNDGKLYRNRAAAYRDYPNGRGYKKCVGAQYGNTCRCKVTKRGKARSGENMSRDLVQLIDKARVMTASVSGRGLIPHLPDNGLPVNLQPMRAEANSLYLYDAIGGWDGTKAIDVAMALKDMTGPIDLHINSPGGIIFEGAAIYNALRSYTGGPITSWIDGYAASAASFIALAASPYDAEANTGGVRGYKNAMMMIHDGMGLAMGTADDMRDVADLLDMLSDNIAQIYADRAGGTAEDWRDQMREGDTWYGMDSAKEAGLIDLIVDADPAPEPDPEPANKLTLDMFLPGAPAPANSTILPFDLEGLRSALKGAFTQ